MSLDSGANRFEAGRTQADGLMLLEASAGTGKTYALERIVADFVGRDTKPIPMDQILVVTFTNRAAREMKERIRRLIAERAGDSERSGSERGLYRRALSDFDRAPIHTIHGFCRMVLSAWPFESSAPFSQELVPGGEIEIEEARRWLAGDAVKDVDPTLLAAAYDRAGGAEALAAKIAVDLQREDIPPGSKVFPEMDESRAFAEAMGGWSAPDSPLSAAADALFGEDWNEETVRKVFRNALGKTKRGGSLKSVLDHMSFCRGKTGLAEINRAVFGGDFGSHLCELLVCAEGGAEETETDEDAVRLIGAIKDFMAVLAPYTEILPGKTPKVQSLVERCMRCSFSDIAAEKVGKRISRAKDVSGRWGYGDLIVRVSEKSAESDSPLRDVLRERFRAALIDEFQDTDPRQWDLFRNLFHTPDHHLVLIGDPKQSIYGFRGTGLQAYTAARETVIPPKRYVLDTNYRSAPKLVDAVNRLFSPLFSRDAGGGRPVGFQPVTAGKTNGAVLDYPEGERPLEFLPASSSEDMALAVTGRIRGLLDPERGGVWRRHGAEDNVVPVSANDIAVLVRSAVQEEDMIARLTGLGVPALRVRSRSVLNQPAAGYLAALLEAVAEPRDLPRWRSVLLGGFFRLPPACLEILEHSGCLDAFVEQGALWRDRIQRGAITAVLDDFFGFAAILAQWLTEAGEDPGDYGEPWPRRVLNGPQGDRHWQDFRHLCELLQEKQAAGMKDIHELHRLLLGSGSGDAEGAGDALRLETEAPAVRVMTMHASKGLEFPLVFLLGGFRKKSRRGTDQHYRFDEGGRLTVDRLGREDFRQRHLAYAWEEDKRLWYVALTRASSKLWLPLPEGDTAPVLLDSLLAEALIPDSAAPPGGTGENVFLPVHEILGPKDGGPFRDLILTAIQGWAEEGASPVCIGRREGEFPPLPAPESFEPEVAPLPPDIPGERDPVTGSYTSLIKAASWADERHDRDVDGDPDESGIPTADGDEIPLSDDRGTLFGTLVHSLLEKMVFDTAADDNETEWLMDKDRDGLFQDLSRRCFPPHWYRPRAEALKHLVRNSLRSPVPGLGRLCDISSGNLRNEVEFLMEVPQGGILHALDLEVAVSQGFLKGYIDLLLRGPDGRWWVVDWKTNIPPGAQNPGDYNDEAIRSMMDHHHYHLQYELYLLALCRTLSGSLRRPVNWDGEIGGAVYLFVRGVRESDSRAIFADKPEKDRMLSLTESLGFHGVIA